MSLTINAPANLPKAQQRAVNRAASILADARHQQAGGHDVAITISVETTDYGHAWLRLERDIPTLGENNLLRFLESQDGWFILIGKRGALTAKRYPKSINQFRGKSFCGINID